MSLSLNCLIHGENQQRIFTVEVEKTENVSTQRLDREGEGSCAHLGHVDSKNIDLLRVLTSNWMNSETVLVNLNKCPKLSPHMILSSLHIIPKAPGTLL